MGIAPYARFCKVSYGGWDVVGLARLQTPRQHGRVRRLRRLRGGAWGVGWGGHRRQGAQRPMAAGRRRATLRVAGGAAAAVWPPGWSALGPPSCASPRCRLGDGHMWQPCSMLSERHHPPRCPRQAAPPWGRSSSGGGGDGSGGGGGNGGGGGSGGGSGTACRPVAIRARPQVPAVWARAPWGQRHVLTARQKKGVDIASGPRKASWP